MSKDGDESDDSLFGIDALQRVDDANESDDAMESEKKMFEDSGGSNVYGILTFEGTLAILNRAKKVMDLKGKTFCDVGSGDAEAIMVAAEQFPELKGCLGIELSKYRHNKALKNLKTICKPEAAAKIELRCEDGLKADISKTDIVYVSNLLAAEKFNVSFGALCDRQLRPGTILFAIKPVPLKRGKLVKELTGDAECSWGLPKVHGYQMLKFESKQDEKESRP
mmetsp:Transcript_30851/g.75230  ORF Transcript_30851/g.75230 Transcript_30851/m.75230 type:complete len:223 (-) Transcript_30851:89-757(-)|eukprot:CAMPEP_0114490080 /NCGR_PEP_ID=MMETSP0109-20121206/2239_1 /TAXON_ID=29199 /ORGANISM="Chlorarachnion reptans, Strain CCCM449" /LENGTH=222 /DNA_ID=CAMNT_0001666649 /DNA_START=129 /DNA_END=797 /DNA_ORIENTATION=-